LFNGRKLIAEQRNLLAMTINFDTNSGGASRGSIRCNYERVGENPSVYPYFERLFHPALGGDCLLFQRVGGKCAGLA
jgi:hypothetical protein